MSDDVSKRCLKRGGPVYVLFYNKLPWFVSELPEKDISNVVVHCTSVFYNKLPWFVSELPEKDVSNVVVQCR